MRVLDTDDPVIVNDSLFRNTGPQKATAHARQISKKENKRERGMQLLYLLPKSFKNRRSSALVLRSTLTTIVMVVVEIGKNLRAEE